MCHTCGLTFKTIKMLQKHSIRHAEYSCMHCLKPYRNLVNLQRHAKQGARYSCAECHQHFGCQGLLEQHMVIHGRVKKHVCNCGKSYKRQGVLEKHQLTCENYRSQPKDLSSRQYICKHCGASNFKCKDSLKSHELVHTNPGRYKCPTCLRLFNHRSDLIRHKNCDRKMLQCKRCGSFFNTEQGLKNHIQIKHLGNTHR